MGTHFRNGVQALHKFGGVQALHNFSVGSDCCYPLSWGGIHPTWGTGLATNTVLVYMLFDVVGIATN